jgi:hypothetical protein
MSHPAIPYVLPFAVFVAFLAAADFLHLGEWEFPFRVVVLSGVLWFSRRAIDLRASHWLLSTVFGLMIFFVWIAPDALIPGYREHWLFQNKVTGKIESSIPAGFQLSPMVLIFRTVRAVVIVPIVEELFWRGWLMRWLIKQDFESVPIGAYRVGAFLITALLFASEHGPYWDVGLIAGIAYNAWAVKTRTLADCILAHAVTNAALCAYVIGWEKWEYWL